MDVGKLLSFTSPPSPPSPHLPHLPQPARFSRFSRLFRFSRFSRFSRSSLALFIYLNLFFEYAVALERIPAATVMNIEEIELRFQVCREGEKGREGEKKGREEGRREKRVGR